MYLKDVVEKLEDEIGFRNPENNLRMGVFDYDLIVYTGNLEPFRDITGDIGKATLDEYPFIIHTLFKGTKKHDFVFCEELNQKGVLIYLINVFTKENELEEFSIYFKGHRINILIDLYCEKYDGTLSFTELGYIYKGVVRNRKVVEERPNLLFEEYTLKNFTEGVKRGKIKDLDIQPSDFKVVSFGLEGVLQVVQYDGTKEDYENKTAFFLTVNEVNEYILKQYQEKPKSKFTVIACDVSIEPKFEDNKIIWPIDLGKYF